MYRLVTSIETRIVFSGTLVLSIKLMKSVVSLMYDFCVCYRLKALCSTKQLQSSMKYGSLHLLDNLTESVPVFSKFAQYE